MGMAARADLVIELSRQIMRKHGGVVPEEDAELRTLPGVGDYLASTVRCLVFGARTVVLHESSRRIISRFTGRSADSNWTARLELFLLAGPAGPDAEFNLALSDLGAAVCTASDPRCGECPLAARCTHAVTLGSVRRAA